MYAAFRISLHKPVFNDDNYGKFVVLAYVGLAYHSGYLPGVLAICGYDFSSHFSLPVYV